MIGKYKVITLCGSTRFKDAFMEVQKRLTLEGNIVISVGLFGHSSDDEVWTDGTKEMLDNMHRAKIDMADEIFVIDVDGYIGQSTRLEIEYARSLNKPVEYMSCSKYKEKPPTRKCIEDFPYETFFREWFHNCKTLEFTSKDDRKKRFVEYVDETDVSANIIDHEIYEDLSVKNAVRKMINEKEENYFFAKDDLNVYPVYLDDTIYFVKFEDITKRWPNHYWLRPRQPIVGFKAVSKNGGSVMSKPTDPTIRYRVGEEYSADENAMLQNNSNGTFFSPSFYKAMSYLHNNRDGKLLLVAASGLILVHNQWDDMACSKLKIIKELSSEDIDRIDMEMNNPRGFWNEYSWGSYDDDFDDEIWQRG